MVQGRQGLDRLVRRLLQLNQLQLKPRVTHPSPRHRALAIGSGRSYRTMPLLSAGLIPHTTRFRLTELTEWKTRFLKAPVHLNTRKDRDWLYTWNNITPLSTTQLAKKENDWNLSYRLTDSPTDGKLGYKGKDELEERSNYYFSIKGKKASSK